jgi:phospholipase C
MPNRRDFLREAAALTGAGLAWSAFPGAIARALAIDPSPGTTFHDAEHVVILMQENRSFDHCYGALRGVRGYRDPRAHVQPNGNPVWFQTDAKGDTYAPFRLDIRGSNAAWIGGLPHTWPDQVDARNGGAYDKWLIAKPNSDLPFALGHYTREDVPFYYALADAFTVCDQAFCSSLTGTTPNRLFLWTGTIREDKSSFPRVMNEDADFQTEAAWRTYPERLEDAGVSWRIYQNEIGIDTGLKELEDAWLSNFGDNPIEYFTQYNIRHARNRRAHLPALIARTTEAIGAKERALQAMNLTREARTTLEKELADLRNDLRTAQAERATYTEAAWGALSSRAKALHERAFTTNTGDPAYRKLATLTYTDGGAARKVEVPKGDLFHQFRRDVRSGSLPAVSWIVAPQNFSDHPSSPWYGAWYISELLDTLTKNPEVWKKTVLILCYDENDGYFDHVPPFVAPHPTRPETGKASSGIDTTIDWANAYGRESSIGLGFRVPLVVASPWSRGGWVNSEIFDHTSMLRFLEAWLKEKGRDVKETNISDWRRVVCGDLTSTFRPYNGEKLALPVPLERNAEVERIHAARFRTRPHGGAPLTKDEMKRANVGSAQEPGTRPSCALPYELVVNAEEDGARLALSFEARTRAFGAASLGAPFNLYSYGHQLESRAYAVRAGDVVRDVLPVACGYRVRVDGPNGFMREFVRVGGGGGSTGLKLVVEPVAATRGLDIRLSNTGTVERPVTVHDESYGAPDRSVTVSGGAQWSMHVETRANHGWYDFSIRVDDVAYRYAGRVENGEAATTDPVMGA